MWCIGLTGTIASGKSTIAKLFEALGVEIISADHISKALTVKGSPAFAHIVNHFGVPALTSEGELNRSYIRKVIFTHRQEKIWLENYLHPKIRQAIKKQVENCKSLYCIIEIPLLINRKNYPYMQRILLITADREIRINRLMERGNHSRKEALLILAAQSQEEQYKKLANDIIVNDGLITTLENKVITLHHEYLKCAQTS